MAQPLLKDRWLTIKQVCQVEGFEMLKPATLRYLLRNNDAPQGVKVGGVWYWKPTDILSWFEDRKATGVLHPHGRRPDGERRGRPRRSAGL